MIEEIENDEDEQEEKSQIGTVSNLNSVSKEKEYQETSNKRNKGNGGRINTGIKVKSQLTNVEETAINRGNARRDKKQKQDSRTKQYIVIYLKKIQ